MSILHLRMSVFCFVVLLCFTSSMAAGEASENSQDKNDKIKVSIYQPQEFVIKGEEDDFFRNMDTHDAEIIKGIISHEKELISGFRLQFPTEIINDALFISTTLCEYGGNAETIKTEIQRAMALLCIAHDIQKIQGVASVNAIGDLCVDSEKLAKNFLQSGGSSNDLALRFGFYFSSYLLSQINTTDQLELTDVEDQLYSFNKAKCYRSLGLISDYMGDYGKSVRFTESGISLLQKSFGESVSKYGIYVTLLYNLGVTYYGSDSYEESLNYALQSLAALENCLYECPDVNVIQHGVMVVRSKLKEKHPPKPEL